VRSPDFQYVSSHQLVDSFTKRHKASLKVLVHLLHVMYLSHSYIVLFFAVGSLGLMLSQLYPAARALTSERFEASLWLLRYISEAE
jgi:hypothetical protein